jgi:REP element-mobilizing transposase RayT
MRNKLERRYGSSHLHFVTFSCYRLMPLLASPDARDKFLKILSEVPDRYDLGLFGYVVMPEHVHLLISEPNVGNPSEAMAVLKQRVSRTLRAERKNPSALRCGSGTNQSWRVMRGFDRGAFTISTFGA